MLRRRSDGAAQEARQQVWRPFAYGSLVDLIFEFFNQGRSNTSLVG